MSYKDYLGRSFGGQFTTPNEAIEGVRQCPVGQMTLCVTSEAEMRKCVRMRTALNAQLLSPKMSCKRSHSFLILLESAQRFTFGHDLQKKLCFYKSVRGRRYFC
jgi:hypothetical protein